MGGGNASSSHRGFVLGAPFKSVTSNLENFWNKKECFFSGEFSLLYTIWSTIYKYVK